MLNENLPGSLKFDWDSVQSPRSMDMPALVLASRPSQCNEGKFCLTQLLVAFGAVVGQSLLYTDARNLVVYVGLSLMTVWSFYGGSAVYRNGKCTFCPCFTEQTSL